MSTHANRVKMTVTSVASAGTGDITLNAASAGFRSFATAYGANATVDILITEGTAWEIARNCTYTHSGTTVSRGTLENSSTGSAVAFTSAAVVSVIATALKGNKLEQVLVSGFSAYGDGSSTVSITNGGTTVVSSAAKTEEFDIRGDFDTSTGIWLPTLAGLYLIGGTAIIGPNTTDGATTAVYIEHSTDGSTWTDTTKRSLLWRGVAGSGPVSVGGSGVYLVNVDGSSNRFRMTVFYGGTGTNTCPASASNRDWIRFWARYIGETA